MSLKMMSKILYCSLVVFLSSLTFAQAAENDSAKGSTVTTEQKTDQNTNKDDQINDDQTKITASRAELLMIIDKSGSMYSLRDDTIGGFNSMIAKFKEQKVPISVTSVFFNKDSSKVHDHLEIDKVKELTAADYSPQGTTALLDAMGSSITNLASLPGLADNKDVQVIVVIITDGMENSSEEYSKDNIKKMIQDYQEKGWKFVFLGANIDAVAEAESLGIDGKNAVKYKNSAQGVRSNYEAVVDFANEAMAPQEASEGSWKDKIEKDE